MIKGSAAAKEVQRLPGEHPARLKVAPKEPHPAVGDAGPKITKRGPAKANREQETSCSRRVRKLRTRNCAFRQSNHQCASAAARAATPRRPVREQPFATRGTIIFLLLLGPDVSRDRSDCHPDVDHSMLPSTRSPLSQRRPWLAFPSTWQQHYHNQERSSRRLCTTISTSS